VDHDEPRATAGAGPSARRGDRGRPGATGNSERVAAAALAAVEGLKGVQRHERPHADDVMRSPGVAVLFESVTSPTLGARRDVPRELTGPPPAGATAEPATEAAPHADPKPPDSEPPHSEPPPSNSAPSEPTPSEPPPSEPAPMATAAGVWNPFRQRRPGEPAGGTSRPKASHLHTRRSATEATVIATLEHGGRLAHGTAVGPPAGTGVLRAVADATVAALKVVTNEPLTVGVQRITLSLDDDPPIVSAALAWRTTDGVEILTGSAVVRDDPEYAAMEATLDALGRRIERLMGETGASSRD
jgi:hypothetical protein